MILKNRQTPMDDKYRDAEKGNPKKTRKKPDMRNPMKTIRKIIFFFFGVAGLWLLAVLFGPEEVGGVLAGAGAGPAAVALLFALQLATLAASAWIWHYLLNREGKIAFGSVFLINQAAGLVESLTPSVKFGGEAAKIYLFRQRTGQAYGDITGILLLHKFLTMTPFTFLCILLFPPAIIYFDPPPAFHVSLLLLVAASVVLYRLCYSADPGRSDPAGVARPAADPSSGHADDEIPGDIQNEALNRFSRIGGKLLQLPHRSVSFLHQARLSAARLLTRRQTLKILTVSLAIWAFYPVKVYLACHFLGLEVHLLVIAIATLFAYVISMLPLLPGGLGTYEGTMALLFTTGGLSPAEGLAVSLVSRLATFWFPLLLSVLSGVILFSGDVFSSGKDDAEKTPAPGRSGSAEPVAK